MIISISTNIKKIFSVIFLFCLIFFANVSSAYSNETVLKYLRDQGYKIGINNINGQKVYIEIGKSRMLSDSTTSKMNGMKSSEMNAMGKVAAATKQKNISKIEETKFFQDNKDIYSIVYIKIDE